MNRRNPACGRLCVGLTLLLVATPLRADDTAKGRNRLAAESSPYLKLHANNPVHWYPWGKEALAEARRTDKPIFLSIGYSSCHWCHVMNRESFANPEIAKILNEHFICIKVDREERPDVDMVYMEAVQTLTGRGGWPLSAFLLPDGRFFVGGTYFPPQDRIDKNGQLVMLGFPNVLSRVIDVYKNRRADVEKQAEAIKRVLEQSQRTGPLAPVPLEVPQIEKAVDEILASFDPQDGGLASPPHFAPKFPQPTIALLALDLAKHKKSQVPPAVVLQADRMAAGGIYDHVGGGFHRYSVDRKWVIPHFEKMLYDQGQLLSYYSRLYARQPAELYRRAILETIAFLEREMTSPEGLFYSALDADSEHEEGKFYVWDQAELTGVLGGDAHWVRSLTGADGPANFEGRHHLLLARSPAEVAQGLGISEAEFWRRWTDAKVKLREARSRRVRPLRDTKAITSWNGLTIVGLVDAAEALADTKAKSLAQHAAEALLRHLRRPDGQLARLRIAGVSKGDGFADDYAAAIVALLAVHRLTHDYTLETGARELGDRLLELFWDRESATVRYTPKGHDPLVMTVREFHDGATPSATSLTAWAMVDLHRATGEKRFAEVADQIFRANANRMFARPHGSTTLLRALLRRLETAPKGWSPSASATQPGDAIVTVKPKSMPWKLEPGQPFRGTLEMTIREGWHLSANPARPAYLQPTVLQLKESAGVELKQVSYPPGELLAAGGVAEKISAYQGVLALGVELQVTAAQLPRAGKLTFVVTYQACDDRQCLAPTETTVEVDFVQAPAKPRSGT